MGRHLSHGLRWSALLLVVSGSALAARSGQSPARDAAPITTGWKITFDGSGSLPVLADGALFVGSADGALYAIDARTGSIKWRFQTGEDLVDGASTPAVVEPRSGAGLGGQIAAGRDTMTSLARRRIRRIDMEPVVENGLVFVGSGDHSFYAVDAATGRKTWSYLAGPGMASNNSSAVPEAPAIVSDGAVYFVTEEGVHAVDAVTGARRWLFETLKTESTAPGADVRRRTPSRPVLSDGVMFVTAWPFGGANTPRKGFVYALEPVSGKPKWVSEIPGVFISEAVAANGRVFVSASDPSVTEFAARASILYALDVSTGVLKWTTRAPQGLGDTRVLAHGDRVLLTTDRVVTALDPDSGRGVWTFGDDQIRPGVGVDGRFLYLVSSKSSRRSRPTLSSLDLSTGAVRWALPVDATIATVQDGVVYVEGDRLRAIDAASGKELWSTKVDRRASARLLAGALFIRAPTVSFFGTSSVDKGYLWALDAKTGKVNPARK